MKIQLIRYLLGGTLGVVAYFVTLLTLTEVFKVWYIISATVAFVINNVVNFICHKLWTFSNSDTKGVGGQLVFYFANAAAFVGLNALGLYVLVDCFGLHYLIAQLMVSTPITLANFLITRWLFRKTETTNEGSKFIQHS